MVAIIFCGDLKYCPYINRYIERLEQTKTSYKVFFWNRSSFNLHLPDNYIYFDLSSKLTSQPIEKLLDFMKFRRWLLSQLKKERFNKLIVLSTLTGVLLGRYLYNNSSIKYIFDIRDYSYEHIPLFYYLEKQVIDHSAFTAISSAGFKAFLPSHNYIIAHNFNRDDIVEHDRFVRRNGKINFVWNGVVRYFEYQKAYLDALKNDSRFNIVFHGDGPELSLYVKYCLEQGFENVSFTGSYSNNDKYKLLKEADILNNCYGYTQNAGDKLKYAVSNRFYDGIIYHIPQLVEPEGYKTEWVNSSGIGVSFEPDDDFANRLYDYYHNINEIDFDLACDNELQKVIFEDDDYIRMIDKFLLD